MLKLLDGQARCHKGKLDFAEGEAQRAFRAEARPLGLKAEGLAERRQAFAEIY